MILKKTDFSNAVFKLYRPSYVQRRTVFQHYLVVEGSTDREAYPQLIKKYNQIYSKNLNVSPSQVITNPEELFNKINSYEFAHKNSKGVYHYFKDEEVFGFYKYQFVSNVIESFKKYLNNKPDCGIDMFGIIDRDCGVEHDLYKDHDLLATTEFRDLESTTLFYTLPSFLNRKLPRRSIEELSQIIDFCVRQGLLEQQSKMYENQNVNLAKDTIKKYIRITKYNFKDIPLNALNIDFDSYVQEMAEMELGDDANDFYLDVFDIYKAKYRELAAYRNTIINDINEWLCGDYSNERFKKLFLLVNGHLFVNQLLNCFDSDIFKVRKETEFLLKAINDSSNKDIFLANPLLKYINHLNDSKIKFS